MFSSRMIISPAHADTPAQHHFSATPHAPAEPLPQSSAWSHGRPMRRRWFPTQVRRQPVRECDQQKYESLGTSSRSEEHTSELQSPCNLVCRLLLEKKKHQCHTRALARRLTDRTERREPDHETDDPYYLIRRDALAQVNHADNVRHDPVHAVSLRLE